MLLQEAEEESILDQQLVGQGEEEVEEYETVTVSVKNNTKNELINIAMELLIPKGGNKDKLYERIRDSGSEFISNVTDNSFDYKRRKNTVGGVSAGTCDDGPLDPNLPRWVVLNPEIPPPIPGIDMGTGAQQGFFGPTNRDNVVGAVRHNFLTDDAEKPKRPEFRNPDGLVNTTSDIGHSSAAAKALIPDLNAARPIDFFTMILPRRFVETVMVNCSNQKAAADGAGAGGTVYKDFVPFDVDEIYRFIGLLFANGIAPKPDVKLWFEGTSREPLFGNDFVATRMDKKLPDGRVIPGVRRWKHFRRFLCLYDFRITREAAAKDPLWKVRRLLKILLKQSMKMWVPGKHLSVDEQTIAFKGSSSMKLRISYKKEGDGFQCDAICDRGYTFSFWFRHGDPPRLPNMFDDLKLHPTSCRVVWLALQLPNIWTQIYMDNLFNSHKLYMALYRAKALADGVIRTSGRGLPPSVKQDDEKNVKRAEALKGTTKAAVLKNSVDSPDLLAVSVYDTKPVHLMSTVSESIRWIVKQKKV